MRSPPSPKAELRPSCLMLLMDILYCLGNPEAPLVMACKYPVSLWLYLAQLKREKKGGEYCIVATSK